jgi:hypothetical protein
LRPSSKAWQREKTGSPPRIRFKNAVADHQGGFPMEPPGYFRESRR